jgi:transcriptional regulator with XRE-family HTH domain
MNVMQSFIEILKTEMTKRGLTVQQAAKAIGCSRQSLYYILSGEREVSLSFAEKVASAFGMTVEIKRKK